MSELHTKLVQSKLDEICYSLATYFNYLIIPRVGYFLVGNSKEGAFIEPRIDIMHIVYLLNEIYPCQNFNRDIVSNFILTEKFDNKSSKPKIKIPQEAKNTIKNMIQNYLELDCLNKVEDPVFRQSLNYKQINDVKIDDDVINKIYQFKIAFDASLPMKEENIKHVLLSMLNKKTNTSFGFNTDIENTALQSMMYVISGLADSIANKYIGINEVISAFKILVPRELQDKYKLNYRDNEHVRKLISDAFISKNLVISNEANQLLTDFMHKVENIKENVFYYKDIDPFKDDTRVLNRLLGFSNYIFN